jgi:putative hemolysin
MKKATIANQDKTKTSQIQAPHPASHFCIKSTGKSEIYYDSENNQHDYCVFENKFIIDSWDFYKRFKHD